MIQPKTLNIKGTLLSLAQPIVMGILNLTPDSFYAASRQQSEKAILARIHTIIDQGASIIDIGAQSTRPSSTLLSPQEEMERLLPTLRLVNREFPAAIVSIDTFYSEVARCAVEEYGVAMINDISGGSIDSNMFDTVAQLQVPYVLMHLRGTPQTMQQHTSYENLLQEVFYYFSQKLYQLHERGVNDIIIDPGFGFSKLCDHNYQLMAALRGFEVFDLPLLVGISRKSMLYTLLGINAEQSLNATTVLNTFAVQNGASILRVHDVREAVETIKLLEKLNTYKV